MSDSSLVPERQLVFSPGLAATIGLEESILLQHLHAQFDLQSPQQRDGFAWLSVTRQYLLRSLPFWNAIDLHRISRSLVDKGVILIDSPPLHTEDRLLFAMNEPVRSNREPINVPPPPAPVSRRSSGTLPENWSPSEDMLQLLALNHNIPRQFAVDQLEDFIFYWRERGETSHAWENKFRQLVISSWRRAQQHQAESFEVQKTLPLDKYWRPSEDALEIMSRAGVDDAFINEAIPEFVLYWRERGSAPKELNSKFVQHIRLQWAKFSSGLEHSTEPKRITEQWQPNADVFDILNLSHIDQDFAITLLPEFIVYWRDTNQALASWNSKFIQHVKYHWAKRHQMQQTDSKHGGQQKSDSKGRTRDRSLAEDLSDTSWAE
ncbi:MAG: DnaT-like ssDNA-binding domain-containing protein [Halioglobus sp.]